MLKTTSKLAVILMLAGAPGAALAQATETDATEEGAEKLLTEQAAEGTQAVEEGATQIAEGADAAVNEVGEEVETVATEVSDAVEGDTGEVLAEGDTAEPAADQEEVIAEGDTAPVAEETEVAEAAEEPAKPIEGQIVFQSENTILANDLLGSTIYSADEENIGDVNDLIVNLDGKVEGIVVGVGGFLGLGEKAVAIEMASLSVMTTDDGQTRLMSDATRTDLEAAEPFKTISAQQAEAEQARLQSESGVLEEETTAPTE